jgi:stage V sporulation protein G
MQITEVRVFPVDEDKLKAFASIVIEDAFVVSDIKIIEGRHGRFLSMPSTKRKNGTFRDIAHPLNQATRRQLEQRIFDRYDEIVSSEERAIVDEVLSEERAAGRGARPRGLPAPAATPVVPQRVGLES